MEDVSKNEGRTVLFVSHNMGAISQLCNKGIVLEKGAISINNTIENAIKKYLNLIDSITLHYENSYQGKDIFISKINLYNSSNSPTGQFKHNEEILIDVEIKNFTNAKCNLLIIFQDYLKRKIFSCEVLASKKNYRLKIERNMFVRGSYSLNSILYTPGIAQFDNVEECCNFAIVDSGSEFSHLDTFDYGVVFGKFAWVD